MTGEWRTGNAAEDGEPTRGWILGHFIEAGDVRSTSDVEVKWGVHPPGDRRAGWVTDDVRTTLVLLVNGGPFTVELEEGSAKLSEQGDYVIWGPGIDHTWKSTDHSVIVTVRWPSA